MNRTKFNLSVIASACAAACLFLSTQLAFCAEGTFDKTLTVHGNVILTVSTGSGEIRLVPGSDNQVHIVGHVKASHSGFNLSAPEERVQQVVNHPPIEQAGNIIRVGKDQSIKNVTIDYDISAPKSAQINLSTGSGNIRVQSVGVNAKLSTGSGSITADGISGSFSADTGSGNIQIQQMSGGDAKAETGSGSIRLTGVQGGLKAQTGSGNIEITGKPTNAWKVDTGSGSIDLNTGSASYTVDAISGSGSVKIEVPLVTEGSVNRHHVTGRVNSGGPLVRLQTGSGSIHIR